MVLSAKTKIKIIVGTLVILLLAIGGSLAYYKFYVKTPQYAVKSIERSMANHDLPEFKRYVNINSVVESVSDTIIQGMIESQGNVPEDTKEAMANLVTMFKAPIAASLEQGINNYVKNGSWVSGDSAKDSQGAMINPDIILEQTGVMGIKLGDVDSVEVNEQAGTAVVGLKAVQTDINKNFVFKLSLKRQLDGYWQVVSIDNFDEFIKLLQISRREQTKTYLDSTAAIYKQYMSEAASNEAQLGSLLSVSSLGSDKDRKTIKQLIDTKIVPQLEQVESSLSKVSVPKSAETLQHLRLEALNSKIAYYQNYAKWLANKDINTLHQSTLNLNKSEAMEADAESLAKRIEARVR